MRAKVLALPAGRELPSIIADKMSCGQEKIPLGRGTGNLIISLDKYRTDPKTYRAAEMKKDFRVEQNDKEFNRRLKRKMREWASFQTLNQQQMADKLGCSLESYRKYISEAEKPFRKVPWEVGLAFAEMASLDLQSLRVKKLSVKDKKQRPA